jgi:ligand-binding SRPBCC domain-containing protein
MYNGLLIEYRVGIPLLGKQKWLSEIKHIREQHSFVDEQRIGPYKIWYHYHEITEVAGGIRFVDRVNYVLPFGPLGAIAHGLFVRRKLAHIFSFREQTLPKCFEA